ncbi:MAG: alpha/beta fold hydrolase [Desulfocapsaceae bacterium]|nr:alpha/beta fold hydrolase [Desulfocapsaceae bacterium]
MLVHGNPTWSFFYRKIILSLRSQYRVIALDNIGCGLSDKPQNYLYTLESHISNLTAFLKKLDIKKCSLILHDWGGAIGMGYAGSYPETIEKIVVLNTAAFRSQALPKRIAVCRIPFIGKLLVRGLNGFARAATFMAVTKPLNVLTKKYYLMPYNSWKNRIAIHEFVKDIPLNKTHRSYDKLVEVEESLLRIRELQKPLLILWGGNDFCFTKEFFDEWCWRFPEAESHYYSNCGHYLLEDCFSEVDQNIQRFLVDHDE